MKKRVISFILCIVLLGATLTNFSYSYAAEEKETTQDAVTVIACSDYQSLSGNSSSSTIVSNILSQIKAAGYNEADGFFAAGDYDYEYTETSEGITSLKDTIKKSYPNIDDDKMIFVQGNHDVAGSDGLSASGEHDTDDYGVYVIHEDEYPSGGGSQEGVQAVAKALDDYLQAKADAEYEKPIFVVSHLPLHYSTRTRNGGDGKYAQYIFEVLNKHAAEGQTIIYMFGHNHNSWGYDDYLGAAAVYLSKGDEIYVAKAKNYSAVPTEYELQFTYMNAGYVGYNFTETPGADKTLTMTVFQIEDDLVTVERYSASGIHNMKSQGYWANTSYQVDSKDNYGADDSYLNKVYKSPQTIFGSMKTDENVQVITSSLTTLDVEERISSKDEKVHRAYRSYDVETTGYTQGAKAIVRVTLPKDSGFDLTDTICLNEKETGMITSLPINDGQVSFETTQLGDFELVQFKPLSSVTTEKTVYQYVASRNKFTDGKKYLIVSKNTAGDAWAMKNESGETITSAPVDIKSDSDGNYIETTDNSIVWEYDLTSAAYSRGVGDLKNQATGRYLYAGEGNLPLAKENADLDHTYWNISSSLYVYTYQNWDTREGTRWSIKYTDQFVLDTAHHTTNQVYVFEETISSVEESISMDSSRGKVIVGADSATKTGSNIVFFKADGSMDVVEVTLSMLRDENGNAIHTNAVGKQSGLQVYYKDELVFDDYTLAVCHENGYNYMDISEYREGNEYTYPEEIGYVFAGWYEDASFKKPLRSDVTSGWAYAKFVDAEVLEAKYQIALDTTMDSEETSLRLVTTVDSTYYRNVGFVLRVDGVDSKPCVSDTVYETIIGKKDGQTYTYYPDKTFDNTSKYFMIHEVTEIPKGVFETDITIRPRWTTMDGTVVYGSSRVMNIYENIYTPDFYQGITFEHEADTVDLFGISNFASKAVASYVNEGVDVEGYEVGARGLKLTQNSGYYYPAMQMRYGDATSGTQISFMVYIDTEATGSKWWIESNQGNNRGDFLASGATGGGRDAGYGVNEWIEVSYTLQENVTGSHNIFFNFDNGGEELATPNTTIYIDNIKLTVSS